MSTFSNICIFCSRDCIRIESLDSESQVLNEKRKAEILHQFVKLTERYLNTSFHLNTVNGNGSVLESCQDCFILVDSFCNLYHQLKCLEMELEWKLRVLSDAINNSRSKNVTSRFSSQCSSEDEELSEVLENFRTEFQQKCIRHFTKSFPKVSLNRWKGVATQQEACHLNNQADVDFNQLFMSWVSTLAVVFQLGFENRSQTYNPEGSGDQQAGLISDCDDDDDYFEVVQHREDLSSHDITDNNSEGENGYPAAPDNQFVEVSKLESSEFKKPVVASQTDSNDLIKVRNRKRKGLQKYYSKRQNDLPPKPLFRCSRCCRNFLTFHQLQRHCRAFTHLLMKRKSLGQPVNPSRQKRTTKRQIKKCNKTGTNNEDKNENVGVLRPLRVIKKPSCAKDEDEKSSEADEKYSLDNAEDEWNMSSSDDDEASSSSSESIYSSSSSGSISSDEEEERPCSSASNQEVATESYPCTVGFCFQRFHFKEELDDHLQLHGSFPCSLCDVIEKYAPNLALHESDHMKQRTEDQAEKGEKKRKTVNVKRNCARCSFSAEERFRYINHYLESHLDLPTQRIKCWICEAWTKDSKRFTEHMKNVHGRKADGSSVYKCEKCPANFVTKIQLLKHQKNHPVVKKEKKYFCNEVSCKAGFATNRELFIHKRLHGSFNPKFNKKCDFGIDCRMAFESEEDLETHRKLHGEFTCSRCPVVENYAPNLAVHEATHVESLLEPSTSSVKGAGSLKPYSCPRCTSVLQGRFHYVTHFLEVHLNLPSEYVTCQNCGEKFPNMRGLRAHFNQQHKPNGKTEADQVNCDQCSAFFFKAFQLAAHRKKMHGEDNSTCVDCGRKFSSASALRGHRATVHKINEADFPHACNIQGCERRFENTTDLIWHKQMSHDGKGRDKTMICHECGKKLSHRPALISHMRLHQADKGIMKKKIYVCEECGKYFDSAEGLKVHKLSHTGPPSWDTSNEIAIGVFELVLELAELVVSVVHCTLFFGIIPLTSWTAAKKLESSYIFAGRDKEDILKNYEELKDICSSINCLWSTSTLIFAILNLTGLMWLDDLLTHSESIIITIEYFTDAMFIIIAMLLMSESCRIVAKFQAWVVRRDVRLNVFTDQLEWEQILQDLEKGYIGICCPGFYQINYGFLSQHMALLITLFAISFQ